MKTKDYIILVIKEKSEYFKCPKCGYSEARLVLGDIATSPCPNCGHTPLYRIK